MRWVKKIVLGIMIDKVFKNRTKSWFVLSKLMFALLLPLLISNGVEVHAQVVINETTLTSGTYTVLDDGQVTISLRGGDGGDGTGTIGGQGATVTATFNVSLGDVIRYVVGEASTTSTGSSAGGGGSSGIYINNTLVMVAGGGGGGDNSTGAEGFGANNVTSGDDGDGTGPGLGGINGNGGATTANTAAAGGGGGVFSAGGSGDAGGGGAADATTAVLTNLLDIATGGSGNGNGTAGGQGFTGGGGADSNYSGGGAGYSGGGGAGANGSAGGGGSYVDVSAVSSNFTAGTDGAGTGAGGSITVTYSDTNPPSAPSGVTATSLIAGDIEISFSDVDDPGSGNASYSIQRSLTSGSGYIEIGTVTDNESPTYTYLDDTGTEGSVYFYIVTATDGAGNESVNSSEVSALSDASAPIPVNVNTNVLSATSVEISFDDLDESESGVASYSIQRSTTQGTGYSEIGTVSDNESASYTYTDNTVVIDNIYYYVVTALDNLGNESSNSAEVSANTDIVAPLLTNASANGTAIALDYDENLDTGSTPATSDFVVRVNSVVRSVSGVSVSSNSVFLTINPAASFGETIEVDYSAGTNPIQDAAGNTSSDLSAESVFNNTADNIPPSAPTNVTATAIFGGDINVSFDDVDEVGSGVSSYSVKRSTTSGSGYVQIGTVTDNESVSYIYTDNTAVNGTTYYYVVSAIDGSSNESSNSSEDSAEAGSVVDGTPPSLVSTSVSNGELILDYDETLDGTSVPANGDFTVSINNVAATITGVSVNGDKVSITFSPNVFPGDNVELDYTAGTNPTQDLVGNDAANLANQNINNQPAFNTGFGPDPCPIVNGHDAAWACFNGISGGTSMTAEVGGLVIGTVTAVGVNTTFSPNALQSWASGDFSGDQFNGPQINPSGATGDATSFDIDIPSTVPSDGVIISLNRLRPDAGATTYTLEAFDGVNQRVNLSSWTFGQGTDGGVCTNGAGLVFANASETIEFQPLNSANPSCASSSIPTWFRIGAPGVERIEIRKTSTNPDNIFLGMALVADFGDAPATYSTTYSSRSVPPAFHILNNVNPNTVYFGAGVDGDGNGAASTTSNGDDTESSGIGNGDDEDAISALVDLNTAQSSYSTTIVCTDGGNVGGWIDFDQSGTFDIGEFDSGVCSAGSVTLNWFGLSGLVTGTTNARFRIATNASEVSNPTGAASDGEVEDYQVDIIVPPQPDLQLTKTVDQSTPVEGDTVNFTLKVKNLGPDPATGVEVTDVLPAGLTFVSSTSGYTNGTGIWTAGNIAVGDSVSLTIEASVNASTLGQTITNSASITLLNETDPNLTNNSASSGITVVPESSDIEVLVSVDDNTALEGQSLVLTVTATNNGPKDATNLTILDQIPTGLSYQSSSATVGSYNNTNGTWTIGNLASGSSATLTINVDVDPGTEGNQITNAADVNTLDQNDPNAANNTASTIIDVVTPGYPASCNDVTSLQFIGSTLTSGTAGQVGAIYTFNTVTPGVYAEFEILTVNNAILVNFDQTASGGLTENFQPQIEADDKNLDEGYIDFEISFYDSVTNNPRYLTFSASAVDVDGDPNGAREFAGFQRLTSFTIETNTNLIQNSEGIFTTFESAQAVVVPGIDPADTDNLAFTTYTNEPSFRLRAGIKDPTTNGFLQRLFAFSFDPCNIDNFDTPTSTDIVDLSVTKAVNFTTPEVADTVIYTITAKNEQGNAVGSIEIDDDIPTGLTYVPASAVATLGTYNAGTGIWDIGTFSGQQSATLTIKATVNTGQEGNTITNTAAYTNFSGTDGNINNNSASVDIIVADPNITSCNEPPFFTFINPNLEQGVPLNVNAIYRFSNVASGVDALVKVVAISNATLDNIDDDGTANSAANFSPFFTALSGGGYIDYQITLVQTGTTNPVKRSFALTGLDIDGTDNGGGETIRDYLGFAQNQSSTVESAPNLNVSSAGSFQLFESSVTTDGNGSFDTDHMAYIFYNYTSVLDIRTGSFATGGYSDDRLVDIDFTQCRNQDFDTPVTTTRNADIAISKTADETNPLENETVNFTITATNNGSEDATELDVNEAIPAGLTLVQATPSQGTYSQLTNLWSVGSLANGASATLVLETTVNSGLSQDSLINQAYVEGLNQFDPIIANDSSSVTIYISVAISGTVFEDITGDGYAEDTNFGDASGDQQALEDVVVLLFKDGGDGLADGADDVFIKSDTTNNAGFYSFQIGEDADFWIAVNSKTGDLSDGSTWGEQTYAATGALCEDGTGSTSTTTSLGHCFGGRRGTVSDNITNPFDATDLANAEHVIKRTVTGTGITGIDFGFSFNVVTNVAGADQDVSANRYSQGSLHQFITNANSITGANTMRFIPAEPTTSSGGGGAWWKYDPLVNLPELTDPLATIDGTAYQLTAPLNTRDDNPGTVGSGGVVGIDNLSLNTETLKEFELDLNSLGTDAFVVNTSGAFVIRELAIFDNANGIKVESASSGLIENNLFGTRASGADPSGASRQETGILFDGASSTSTLVQENYFAYLQASAVSSTNSNADITVFNNEIFQAGLSDNQADGIQGLGAWTIEQNLIHQIGNGSSLALDGGSGIELGSSTGISTGNTIRNNTIRDNLVAGINVYNNVTNTLIEENIIEGNGTNYSSSSPRKGAGVKLTTPNSVAQEGIKISRNSFYDNFGISIDVVTGGNGEADGVSPNDGAVVSSSTSPNTGLDYPVFTLSTLNGSILHVEGYVGTFSTNLPGPFTIELYKAEDDGDNDGIIEVGGSLIRPHGEGRDLIGTITTANDGTFNTDITLSGSPTIAFNDRITAIAISAANNTSEFSSNSRVVPTGVSITGFVYTDENHNMNKDASETGIQGVTMVLYNVAENNCKSVLTDATGKYEFTNVLNGDYDLIEAFGQSVPAPDVCTPSDADPADHVSTTPNLRSVTVNNLPAFQDFGDFEGAKISGTVFNDNGILSGTPNNGNQDGGEEGFSTQVVGVYTSGNVLIEQTSTAADGSYDLYVPASVAPTGTTIKVKETNGVEKLSTGGSPGTTPGTYDINTDETTFIVATATMYTGVDFADVLVSRLLTDGQQNSVPGGTALFQHTFEPKTGGDVIFTTSTVNNPTAPNWPVILYEDLNCNGVIDSGEGVLTPSTVVTVTANQDVCLLLKVTVPLGLSTGSSSTTIVTATFDYVNSSPVIQEILQRTDLVNVSTESAGLVIIKSVDKAQALPGEILTYTINYENLSADPITQVEITDVIPSFTTYNSSACGTLPAGITNCTIVAPSVGATGTIVWTFTGTLNPGLSGTVSFTVKIDN